MPNMTIIWSLQAEMWFKMKKIYTEQDIIELMRSRRTNWLAAETGISVRRIRRIIAGKTRIYLDEANVIIQLCEGGW